MPTLMQKIKLAIRGWNRRRDEKQQEFLKQNTWSSGFSREEPAKAGVPSTKIDVEGLTVAYLDDSGHFAHYLDTDTGDILDVANNQTLAAPRYRRVPQRTAQSESADRSAFVDGLQPSRGRDELARAIGLPEAFRKALSNDRALERAWYSFKNDRTIAAIESWLRGEALK